MDFWDRTDASSVLKFWLEKTPVACCVVNDVDSIVSVNPAMEKLTGWSNYELKRMGFSSLAADPDDTNMIKHHLAKGIKGDQTEFAVTIPMRRKEERSITVRLAGVRWPTAGDFDFLILNIVALDIEALDIRHLFVENAEASLAMLRSELASVHAKLDLLATPRWWIACQACFSTVGAWSRDNPGKAIAVALFLITLFLGERAIETWRAVSEVLNFRSPSP